MRFLPLVSARRSSPLALVMSGEVLLHRRFFFTKRGYFGLASNAIAGRDKVCISYGGVTLVIMFWRAGATYMA